MLKFKVFFRKICIKMKNIQITSLAYGSLTLYLVVTDNDKWIIVIIVDITTASKCEIGNIVCSARKSANNGMYPCRSARNNAVANIKPIISVDTDSVHAFWFLSCGIWDATRMTISTVLTTERKQMDSSWFWMSWNLTRNIHWMSKCLTSVGQQLMRVTFVCSAHSVIKEATHARVATLTHDRKRECFNRAQYLRNIFSSSTSSAATISNVQCKRIWKYYLFQYYGKTSGMQPIKILQQKLTTEITRRGDLYQCS